MKKNKNRTKKIMIGIVVGYFVLVLAVYFGGSFYFSKRFFKGTTINGISCDKLTAEAVKEKIQEKIGEYQLTITKLDGETEVITAKQLELTYVDDNKVDELLEEQNQWKWCASFTNKEKHELAANTTYAQDKIDDILNGLDCFQSENIVAPQDAYLNDCGTYYEIVPEVEGNTLDQEKVKAAVMEAVDEGKTEIDLVSLECYVKPAVYQDDAAMVEEMNRLNLLLQTNLTYDFDDRQEVVDAALIKGWLYKDESGVWQVDAEQAAAYVQQLAYKYDTYGLTHKFTTYHGNEIELKGGDYGWVIKKQATTDALVQAINEGQVATIEPIYLYEGKCRATNDIGDTYIEVSVDEQRMWCYKDGNLVVDTPVVTGTLNNEDRATPRGGVWAIDGKISPWTLKGEGYSNEVTYWLPFNGNVGVHDADWRSEFGGEIYKTSGSHGCVNTPPENAKKVFDAMEIGDPVIVY